MLLAQDRLSTNSSCDAINFVTVIGTTSLKCRNANQGKNLKKTATNASNFLHASILLSIRLQDPHLSPQFPARLSLSTNQHIKITSKLLRDFSSSFLRSRGFSPYILDRLGEGIWQGSISRLLVFVFVSATYVCNTLASCWPRVSGNWICDDVVWSQNALVQDIDLGVD